MIRDGSAADFLPGLLGESEVAELEPTEIRRSADLFADLAAALPPVAPPARLKDRFLKSIRPHEHGLGAIRAEEGRWRQGDAPGVTWKKLYFDKASGLLTTLVRLEPGAVYPAHRHTRTEQCLVLEGDLIHDDHVYGPGDFTWAEAGSLDPALHTRGGTLLLIIGAPDNELTPA